MIKRLAVPVAMVALLAAAMYVQSSSPEPTVCDSPAVSLPDLPGYEIERMSASEAELRILPGDTSIDRRAYKAPGGRWNVATLVIGGKHKGSIHRPELCLPANGLLMTEPHTLDVGGTAWRVITLEGGIERPSLGFAYTFFNQDGFRTASHTCRIFRDVWDRSVHNRIDRWAMVTVISSRTDDRGIAAFLDELWRGLK